MSDNIRRWCECVHSLTGRAERDYDLFLEKIEQAHDTGWSPDTLEMIQLVNDAKALRKLADRIENSQARLTSGYERFVAAE